MYSIHGHDTANCGGPYMADKTCVL